MQITQRGFHVRHTEEGTMPKCTHSRKAKYGRLHEFAHKLGGRVKNNVISTIKNPRYLSNHVFFCVTPHPVVRTSYGMPRIYLKSGHKTQCKMLSSFKHSRILTLFVIADVIIAVLAPLGAPLSSPVAFHPRQSEEHDPRNEDHCTREVKSTIVVANGVIQGT